MSEDKQPPSLAQLTPSLHGRLSSRRRERVDRQFGRLIAPRLWGLTAAELKATAQRAYSNVALLHVFTGNALGFVGAVMVAGYVEDVQFLRYRPLLALGVLLLAGFVVEAVVGVRQSMQVGDYFRTKYDEDASTAPKRSPAAEGES